MGHGIVPDNAGWGAFGWLVAVFLLATMIFALSLQVIIRRLRRVGKEIDRIFLRENMSTSGTRISTNKPPKARMVNDMFGVRSLGLRRRRWSKETRSEDLETGAEAE